jgi:hypothetical protein
MTVSTTTKRRDRSLNCTRQVRVRKTTNRSMEENNFTPGSIRFLFLPDVKVITLSMPTDPFGTR